MSKLCADPTIHDLLNDPLTQAVMRADGVEARELKQMLGSVALEIERSGRQADYRPSWQHEPLAVAAGTLKRWSSRQFCGAC